MAVNHPSRKEHRHTLAEENRAASRVTLIGMVLDAVLGALKIVAGTLFHSQALIVDGIHSFTDVASDLVVLAVMKVSRQAPDDNHPYGHQRIETFGTLILGSILIAVGAALAWEYTLRLMEGPSGSVPEWPVLVAAGLSVAGKEWIYRYTRRVGERIRSDLIVANAWHSRTDAFSSVLVLLSTIGAMLGWLWLDILAAIVIAAIIGLIGWQFTWNSVRELVDTGLSAEETQQLRAIALGTEGVRDVHELRGRNMGQDVLLDVHLVVPPDISVSEGHQIGMKVVTGMREKLPNIRDVNVHIDAENDEDTPASEQLAPSRHELRAILTRDLQHKLPGDNRLRLHYLKNKVHIELFFDNPEQALGLTSEDIRKKLEHYSWFGSARIWIAGG